MKTRHRAREIALQILYQYDFKAQSKEKRNLESYSLARELTQHYDHFSVPPEIRAFIGELVVGTHQELNAIDTLLEKHASHWKVGRMSSVDRSLLRMAAYELVYQAQTTPSTIVINEAIELAKQFGTSDTPAFVNGVLDSLKKALISEGQSEPGEGASEKQSVTGS